MSRIQDGEFAIDLGQADGDSGRGDSELGEAAENIHMVCSLGLNRGGRTAAGEGFGRGHSGLPLAPQNLELHELHELHAELAVDLAVDLGLNRIRFCWPPKAALATGYACRNRSDKAEEMLERYKLKTVEPYTALMKLYFRIGVQEKVTSLYKQMKELSIQPNLAAFATLLRQREPSGNVEEIKQDAEEALRTAGAFDEELKLKGSVASYAMVILAYLGKEQETVRMWKHIQEQESISADCYIDAIDAFGALGKVRLAEKVADEMEMTKQSYTRLSAAMIHLYSRCKMMDKAESVMDDLRENGVWTVFGPYSELILGYLDNNQPDRAMVALKKALLVKVVKPSYTVMLKMLPVFERQRDAEGAEDMVNRYRGVTDLRLYKGLLKVYVSSRVKPIEEIEARLILKKIKPDEETIDLLNKLKKIIG